MTDSDSAVLVVEENCSQADLLSSSNKSLFQLPDGWGTTNTSDDDDDNGGPSLLEYRTRIARIQSMHCNETCADCGTENPQWASLLLKKDDGCMEGLGAVVCEHCALHQHYELGEKRCFIKYLQYFHEWTHPELDVLEHCGNDLLNEVYEARYFPDEEEQEPQRDPTSDKHGKFIRNKYKKCKYRDEDALEEALELVNVRANLAKHSPQMPTSSPRRKSSASSLKLLKQHISCSSLLSLSSELTGSSCCLFDLETDQAEFDAADVDADSDDGISFYDDDDDESIQSVPDETLSLPSLNHPAAASENPLMLLEVSSVDRKQQQQQQHQRPPRRVSKFVRKGRPSCIIQGIPHMEESLRTGDTDDLTYVTKSSSLAGGGPSRSLSPCPPTIRLNLATQAA